MATASEQEFLKKLDPAEAGDESTWPEIPLKDVIVYNESSGRLFNLLSAHRGDCALIEGTLVESECEHQDRHKRSGFGKARISIKNVSMYSYGADEEEMMFWAAGNAGWFQIRTVAKTFKPIFQDMKLAASLLYYLSDKVQKQRKKFTNSAWTELSDHVKHNFRLFKNSNFNQGRLQTPGDCLSAFTSYRFFLVKCMLEGAEGIDWRASAYFIWYKKTYPKDTRFLESVVIQKANGPVPIPSRAPQDQEDEEMKKSSIPPVTPVAAPSRAERRPPEELRARPQPTHDLRRTRVTRLQAAAMAEEGSSDDAGASRRKERGKRKRKSMLRPLGAKTPTKSNVRRDGLRAYPNPTMHDIHNDTMQVDDADSSPDSGGEDETGTDRASQEDEGVEGEEEEDEEEGEGEEDDDGGDGDDEGDAMVEGSDERQGERMQPSRDYFEPKGPDNTWACPYDGCNHQVWDAKSSLGVSMIQQHYAKNHSDSIEELIKSEQRPWANISNLLAKVQAWQAEKGRPKPVQRRY